MEEAPQMKVPVVAREKIAKRMRLYNAVFNLQSEDVRALLADLSEFCRGDRSTFHVDPRAHALLEGRREVFLRIKHHLEKSPEEIYQLYVLRK